MKIAISGAHNTGKTILLQELAGHLPDFSTFDEPYWQLVEEGQTFSDPPTVEDYELQLAKSVECIEDNDGDCLFERSPLDFLAYIVTQGNGSSGDLERQIESLRSAVECLDLIVFVPIETPDRIADVELPALRRRVDEEMRELVLNDSLDLGVMTVEVNGSVGKRCRQVLDLLKGSGSY